MANHLTLTISAVVLLLIGSAGWAADRHVHLRVPPPLRQNLAALPRIIDPADVAENRINSALDRLDASVRKAAEECKRQDGNPGDWERSIDVPMRGPGYISFVISDSVYCGGAHPIAETMSIVYDLRTGAPVDWTTLLPAAMTGTVALQEGADGTKMVTLASPRLFELYRAGYGTVGDPDCRQVIDDSGASVPPAMMPWLDAKAGGLLIEFDLAHAVQACEKPVVVPLATLRAEGAQAALVDAIERAHQQ
jgi:hypothetical protein